MTAIRHLLLQNVPKFSYAKRNLTHICTGTLLLQCFRRQDIVILLGENWQNVLSQGAGVSAYAGEESVVEIFHCAIQVSVMTTVLPDLVKTPVYRGYNCAPGRCLHLH